jgi:aminodeoxyfutalosine synthase
MTNVLDLEAKARAGEPFTRADAERLLAAPNLIDVGAVAEAGRRATSGDTVTYGRVVGVGHKPWDAGQAGEVRIVGVPESVEDAYEWVRAVGEAVPPGVPFTAFSLGDLAALVSGDHLALSALADALREGGLEAVAEVPIDALGDTDNAVEIVRAVRHGGLGAWRATIGRAATAAERLDLIERAVTLQHETGALRAFAPLPRQEPAGAPSTGFDDVRTIAAARLMAAAIPFIQVDWPLHGPKLAQVAIAYGANDLDGISARDTLDQGPRRAPVEDIERQIRAAFASPALRNGRYERLS